MKPLEITPEWLEARVIEQDGCWLWKGVITEAGQPQVSMRTPDGRKTVLVRRLVWALVHPDCKPGANLWAYAGCENERCVHPDHVRLRSRSSAMKKAVRSPVANAKMAATKRAKSKLSQDVIRNDVLASEESNVAVAARLGCHHSHIAKIRNGELRREYNSPLAGLGAR